MAKSYCTIFPNCASLALRFNIEPSTLFARINVYNMYVSDKKLRIVPETIYTEEQLDDIFDRLSKFKVDTQKNEQVAAKERAAAEELIGGPEALAFKIANERFTGKEITEITHEITRIMISRLNELAIEEGISVEEFLRKHGKTAILGLMRGVKNRYSRVYIEEKQKLTTLDGKDNSPEATKIREEVKYITDTIRKIIDPSMTGGTGLTSLMILSLPKLSECLGVRISSDFSTDPSANVSYEIAESIRDTEEPQADHWQQALDSQTLEGSLSTIINRVLTQVSQVEKVSEPVTVTDKAGNKVVLVESHSEPIKSTILKENLFSNPTTIARRLANILSKCTSEQEMLRTLKKFSTSGDQFEQLYDILSKDHRLLTTFFQDFNKYFQTCREMTTVQGADGLMESKATPKNKGSRDSGVSHYFGRFFTQPVSEGSIFTVETSEDGRKFIKVKNYREIFYPVYERFQGYFLDKDGNIDKNSAFSRSSISGQERIISSILNALNFPVDIEVVRETLSDSAKTEALISALNECFKKLDGIVSKKVDKGIRGDMESNTDLTAAIGTVMNLVRAIPATKFNSMVNYAGSSISSMILNSPLSILTKKLNTFRDSKIANEDGSTREITTLSDYLEYKYLNSTQFRGANGLIYNRWLRDIYACKDVDPSTSSIKTIFGITRDLGINDTKFEEINDRQHMLMFIMGYLGGRTGLKQNVILVNSIEEARRRSKGDYSYTYIVLGTPFQYKNGEESYRTDPSYIPSFITGDTNALRQISSLHYYEEEVLDGIYDLYLADVANQDVIKEFNRRGIVFGANGKEAYTSRQVTVNGKKTRRSNEDLFGILPFLNSSYDGKKTWYDHFMDISGGVGDKASFIQVTREYLQRGFEEFKLQLEEMGLLDTTPEGKYIYFNQFLDNKTSIDSLLFDFYINFKFSEYNLANITQVNPTFFNGIEEYQKRNKGTLTNGNTLSEQAQDDDGNYVWGYDPATGKSDFNSRVVYFKDIKTGIDEESRTVLINYFTKVFKDDKDSQKSAERYVDGSFGRGKNTLTDGQAYRSFESYRKVLLSAGKSFWSDSQERAYKKIMRMVTPIRGARKRGEIISLTTEQIQEIEDMMAEMQPIKPINDGIETWSTANIKIGFQFKYAEVPLLPELFPVGSKLRELGDEMVDRGIDMLASDKCLKKGSFGEVDLQYKMVNGKYVDANGELLPGMDENGKIIDDGSQTAGQQRANSENSGKFVEWEEGTSVKSIFDAHNLADGTTEFITHVIPMENYLIQGNIPDHTDGNSVLGTQGRKIGTGAIDRTKDYVVGNKGEDTKGTKVSGEQLARIYGVAHALKYIKSFRKFSEKFNSTSEAVSDLIYNILYNRRGNLATIERLSLLDGETPTIPFGEPSNSMDVNSSVISIFKKTVIRQLISGGSIVQASSMGYGSKALTDTGLHAVIKWEDREKGIGTPIAMQTEMAFDFHFKDSQGNLIPLRYEDYCDENGYFLDENGEAIKEDRYDTAIPKIEQDFPGITDIIAYRIPTEMEYSMFHLKVVKCNPKNAGNTIKLPAECTTIAGFDFDIDKLFLMRHNFSTDKAKEAEITDEVVWRHFYSKNEALRQILGTLWKQDGSRSDKKWHEYWPEAMAMYPSLQDKYGDKNAVFAAAKAELLKPLIDKAPIDYNMDITDMTELSNSQLDNLIIDCMVSILSDESTVKDRYTVGGFPQASEDAKLMRHLEHGDWNPEAESFQSFVTTAKDLEDVKPEYDYSDPMTSIIFKEQNQIAGTLIGIFANDSVNNFISKGLKTFRITEAKDKILFGSLKDGVTEVDGVKGSTDDIGLSFLHTSVNGVSVKRTLAELLAASVDAVKDPVLNYLNLNSITADAAAMLARLGYTTRDIGLLLNQPIIKEMCKIMNRTGETNTRRALIMALTRRGITDVSTIFSSKAHIDGSWLSSEALAKNLSREARVDVKSQIAVAQLFNSIMNIKQDFSNFVQKTRNTSANTIKSRFEDYLSSEEKSDREMKRLTIEVNDTLKEPITKDITMEDLMNPDKVKELISKYKDHPFIYENILSNIIRNAMNMMMNKYTLLRTPLYTGYRRILRNVSAPWGVSADQMVALHKDLPTMILSSLPGDFNPKNGNAEKYLLPENFITELDELMNEDPEFANNPIIKILSAKQGDVQDTVVLEASVSSSEDQWELFELTLGWDALMKSSDKRYRDIAKGLFLYFYYTKGLNPDNNKMMSLAPVSVLKSLMVDEENGITYADFFDKDNPTIDSNVVDEVSAQREATKKVYQFLINHNDDPKLVRRVEAVTSKITSELIFIEPKNGRPAPENSTELVTLMRDSKAKVTYYAPVIKVGGTVYVLVKGSGGYEIDYDNIKSDLSKDATRTLRYVPITNEDIREALGEVDSKELFKYYNNYNGIIFNYSKAVSSIEKLISSDDVDTDPQPSYVSSTEEAYDEAEEATENEELSSSDGKPQCGNLPK